MKITPTLLSAALAAAALLAGDLAGAQSVTGGGRRANRLAAENAQPALPPMAPDTVLAQAGNVKVTRADYDVELMRLPPNLRGGFAVNEQRVADLLTRMLLTKQLAAQADSTGVMTDPLLQARLAAETERYKAQVMILHIESDAAKRFDAERDKWDTRARDIYLTEGARFETPEMREVQVLPVSGKKHGGAEAAKKLAEDLRARWLAGETWAKLAPETDVTAGDRLDDRPERYAKSDLPAEIADKVFALPDASISDVLGVGDNWFVFRIVGRVPASKLTFEQAKPQIMNELKQKYIDSERDRILGEQGVAARAGIQKDQLDKLVLQLEPGRLEQLQRQTIERAREKKAN